MYLVHIVPVIWLNALLATIDFPAAVKFAVVLGGTTLVSIATITAPSERQRSARC
jgi:hypothetical protein